MLSGAMAIRIYSKSCQTSFLIEMSSNNLFLIVILLNFSHELNSFEQFIQPFVICSVVQKHVLILSPTKSVLDDIFD